MSIGGSISTRALFSNWAYVQRASSHTTRQCHFCESLLQSVAAGIRVGMPTSKGQAERVQTPVRCRPHAFHFHECFERVFFCRLSLRVLNTCLDSVFSRIEPALTFPFSPPNHDLGSYCRDFAGMSAAEAMMALKRAMEGFFGDKTVAQLRVEEHNEEADWGCGCEVLFRHRRCFSDAARTLLASKRVIAMPLIMFFSTGDLLIVSCV